MNVGRAYWRLDRLHVSLRNIIATDLRSLILSIGVIAPLLSWTMVGGSPAWAASEPAWPPSCLGLHDDVGELAFIRRYHVLFDGKPAGYETFCVVRTDDEDVVFQWTSNAIHKFLGSTAIRHCRKEIWRRTGQGDVNPRQRLQLQEMQSWTNVASDGTHTLAAFLDQVPDPSSIRAVRKPDGDYRYVLLNPNGDSEKEAWSVQGAALRTPWTESMLPAVSVNLMDPVRYRVSSGTEAVFDETDPVLPTAHRRYRVAGPDFAFDLTFREDDGTLLVMDGTDAAVHVRLVLMDGNVEDALCPRPEG